ncbi:MAG: CHAD domain-containing protein [Planctomycetaceae bacterium]
MSMDQTLQAPTMNSSAAANLSESACAPETPLTLLRRLFTSYVALVEQYATKIAHGDGSDAETVHDFRIALRRAETVLSQFRDLIPRREHKWFLTHFKELRKASNPLRDADIFLEHLETYHEHGPFSGLKEKILNGHQSAMNAVQTSCVHWLELPERVEHRARVVDRIDRSLQKRAVARDDDEPTHDLSEWIQARLTKLGRTIFRTKLKWKGWTRLHERRIAAKRLRYALEVYRECLPSDDYDAIYRRLKSLQNRLGTMNDEVTISNQLKEWSRSPATSRAEIDEIESLHEREKSSLDGHLEEFKAWWTNSRRRKWKKQWKDLLDNLEKTT